MIFIDKVIKELNMTQNDISQFSQPKATYNQYCREVIYDINKNQMGLFLNLVNFPDEDVKLRDQQKRLIMFLDHNEKYKDKNYVLIWFNIAHDCFLNKSKFNIEPYEFKKSSKKSSKPQLMSFTNSFESNTNNVNTNSINTNINPNNPNNCIALKDEATDHSLSILMQNLII